MAIHILPPDLLNQGQQVCVWVPGGPLFYQEFLNHRFNEVLLTAVKVFSLEKEERYMKIWEKVLTSHAERFRFDIAGGRYARCFWPDCLPGGCLTSSCPILDLAAPPRLLLWHLSSGPHSFPRSEVWPLLPLLPGISFTLVGVEIFPI